MIAGLIGGFICLLAGAAIIKMLSDEVYGEYYGGDLVNQSAGGAEFLRTVPPLFAVGILGIGAALVISSVMHMGR